MSSTDQADASSTYESSGLVKKPKLTRMSKACISCRKIKVKCRNSGEAPCQRCWEGNLECIFEKSKRGGRRPGVKNVATRLQLGEEIVEVAPAKSATPDSSASTANSNHSQPPPSVPELPMDIEVPQARDATISPEASGPTTLSAPPPQPPPLPPHSTFSTVDHSSAGFRLDSILELFTNQAPSISSSSLEGIHHIHEHAPDQPQEVNASEGDPAFLRLMNPENVRGPAPSNEDYHVPDPDNDDEEREAAVPNAGKAPAPARLDPISVISRAAIRSARGRLRLEPGISPDNVSSPASSHAAQSTTSNVGVADADYFQPSSFQTPAGRLRYITKRRPAIFDHIRAEDVSRLFEFFFQELHFHCPILDKDYHTPERVAQCSPFLMTSVCAVSSHFLPEYNAVQDAIGDCAMKLAFSVPSRGHRSPMSAQAHLILTYWCVVPQARLEEDKTNVLFGLAKSAVFDLGLHRFRQSDLENAQNAVIVRNKIRIYLFTYLRDQELAVQLGRSASIRDSAATRNPSFYCGQPLSLEDLTCCMMIELYRILARTMDYFRVDPGENDPGQPDYTLHTEQFEDQLKGWKARFTQVFHSMDSSQRRPDMQAIFAAQNTFYFHYSLLVVASFGLSNALDRDPLQIGHFFNMCYTSASAVLRSAKQSLSKIPAYRYSPDGFFVAISYAAVSLLRFCQPRLSKYHDRSDSIIELISSTADVLERKAVAPSHVISQYSMFLRALLEAYQNASFGSPSGPGLPLPGMSRTHSSDADPPGLDAQIPLDTLSEFAATLPHNFEMGGEGGDNFGLDQMLPSQWATLDWRFDTVHSFAASDSRNSILLPAFNLPNIDSGEDFMTQGFNLSS
ncbi:hypothetical protein T439DRAFT_350012 [Meredithblackwellia eburnea MCA 4105]